MCNVSTQKSRKPKDLVWAVSCRNYFFSTELHPKTTSPHWRKGASTHEQESYTSCTVSKMSVHPIYPMVVKTFLSKPQMSTLAQGWRKHVSALWIHVSPSRWVTLTCRRKVQRVTSVCSLHPSMHRPSPPAVIMQHYMRRVHACLTSSALLFHPN